MIKKKLYEKHLCPVCGEFEFECRLSHEICEVCGWQDDVLDENDSDAITGANQVSINEAREIYRNNIKPLIDAHKFSNNHKRELENDAVCGCFFCERIFNPQEIREYIIDDNPCDKRGSTVCPYCGIDSVIGESSGFPITKAFLNRINKYWFR